MTVLYYIASSVFALSAFIFLVSVCAVISTRPGKRCTQKGEATLLRVVEPRGKDEDLCYEIAYSVDGAAYKRKVSQDNTEGITPKTPVGSRVPIYYDPEKPTYVIITEDPTMRKKVESWKRTRKRSFIWMLVFFGITAFALTHMEDSEDLPRNTTTIGQFSPEFAALAEKQPDKLIFTESIGSPDTFRVTIEDPNNAKKALDILLNAQVSKVGCQVDMVQYRYEEYCFVFGGETFTFGFLPHSYFCFNGQDYELGKNRISALCDSLHAMAAEGETEKWYGDDAELLTMFVDNGDEARSVTELFLYTGDARLTGYIEGAYDVLSVEKQPDGYVIPYTYGDFYSHDTIRSSRITVENGEMVITDIEQ